MAKQKAYNTSIFDQDFILVREYGVQRGLDALQNLNCVNISQILKDQYNITISSESLSQSLKERDMFNVPAQEFFKNNLYEGKDTLDEKCKKVEYSHCENPYHREVVNFLVSQPNDIRDAYINFNEISLQEFLGIENGQFVETNWKETLQKKGCPKTLSEFLFDLQSSGHGRGEYLVIRSIKDARELKGNESAIGDVIVPNQNEAENTYIELKNISNGSANLKHSSESPHSMEVASILKTNMLRYLKDMMVLLKDNEKCKNFFDAVTRAVEIDGKKSKKNSPDYINFTLFYRGKGTSDKSMAFDTTALQFIEEAGEKRDLAINLYKSMMHNVIYDVMQVFNVNLYKAFQEGTEDTIFNDDLTINQKLLADRLGGYKLRDFVNLSPYKNYYVVIMDEDGYITWISKDLTKNATIDDMVQILHKHKISVGLPSSSALSTISDGFTVRPYRD